MILSPRHRDFKFHARPPHNSINYRETITAEILPWDYLYRRDTTVVSTKNPRIQEQITNIVTTFQLCKISDDKLRRFHYFVFRLLLCLVHKHIWHDDLFWRNFHTPHHDRPALALNSGPYDYLLECPLYDEARYALLKRLREELGIQAPNIYTLLGYDSPVEFPNWRELICEEVGHFIERTERFKETKEQIIASQ